jgi:hypothetical protein
MLAVRQHASGLRVDDFGIEMVLPNIKSVLLLDALGGHAGTDHLREAVGIDGMDAGGALDLRAHSVAPRLGAEHRNLRRGFPRIDSLGAHLIE